jgi:hypothetical protein
MNKIKTIKLLGLLTTAALLTVTLNAKGLGTQHGYGMGESADKAGVIKPKYQGTVLKVLDGQAYTYLKIDEKVSGKNTEKLKAFWIVVDKSSAKAGDYVRFQKELVTKKFTSKTLNRTFDEIMFASKLEYKVSK